MARGKYAARAANRLAEIDAEIVSGLREKLAVAVAERDAARSEVELLTRQRDAEARAVGERLAAAAVQDLAERLESERQARDDDRLRFAYGVSALFTKKYRGLVKAPESAWADLIDLFGLKGREIGRFMGRDFDTRRADRFRSQTLRRYEDARTKARGASVEVAIKLAGDE